MLKSVMFEVVGEQRLGCESCEQRVERALKTVAGVDKVRANSRNQRIEVLFDAATLDTAALADRIGKAGYQTKVISQ